MSIEIIRRIVREKGYRLTAHASIEAMKDGISPADIRYTIFHGRIIEEYPEREYSGIETCLIYAMLPTKISVHIVVDFVVEEAVVVVTVYVPDREQWIASQMRKQTRGKQR
jgi:hypothetical protein